MIKICKITKSFDGLRALDNISCEIKTGEVRAFLGENGAGKSTLMKIISGFYAPDHGHIEVNGEVVSFKSTLDGLKFGIGMVYQDFTLIDSLKIWENFVHIFSTRNGLKSPWFNKKRIITQIKELGSKIGFNIDPLIYGGDLCEGEKQKIEILKLLMSGSKILILDEPTSLLTPQETEIFLGRIRNMAKEGYTVIFITHKIGEAIDYADTITILRDGKLIETVSSINASESALAKLMVGELSETNNNSGTKTVENDVILEMEKVSFSMAGYQSLKNISFQLRKGEIIGVAGISGEGQGELANLAAGYYQPIQGKVTQHISKSENGISLIPENPRQEGVVGDFSVLDNFLVNKDTFLKPVFIGKKFYSRLRRKAISLMEEYDVSPIKPSMLTRNLSGGNLQKLVLARELANRPSLLIALYPTKGLDVGAARFIRSKIVQIAREGTAVMFFSEDIDELMEFCDTILIIRNGEIVSIDRPENFNAQNIGLLMGGDSTVVN